MITQNKSLQTLNTLRCPAVAAQFAELTQASELGALLLRAQQNRWPVTVLGEGSNVVLGDQLAGLVVKQSCKGIEVLQDNAAGVRLRIAAGENWHALVQWCLEQGYPGLENLALIPGTVGAAPIQNIGAYGVEIAPFLETVEAVRVEDAAPLQLDREACAFGYRDSVFKHALRDAVVIMQVTLYLPRGAAPVTHYPSLRDYLQSSAISAPTAKDVFDAVVAIRRSRLPDPERIPNVGSFFKNPVVAPDLASVLRQDWPDMPQFSNDGRVKLPAAWLIDQCGFKQREGAVRVHAEHALVITNPQQHSAGDVAALAREILDAVQTRFGILLEQEPRRYGVQ